MGPLPPSPVIFESTSNLNLGKQVRSEIDYEKLCTSQSGLLDIQGTEREGWCLQCEDV